MKRFRSVYSKKNLPLLQLLFVLVFCIFLFACDPANGGDNGGGQGADFDASLYYTKTEIDARFYEKSVVDAKLSETVRIETVTAKELTGVGWTGRTDGFTVPAGYKAAVMEIKGYKDSSGDPKNLSLTFGGTSSSSSMVVFDFTVFNDDSYYTHLVFIEIPEGTATLYAWHNTANGGASADLDGVTVNVRPVAWFK